jgi:hypothetical protein
VLGLAGQVVRAGVGVGPRGRVEAAVGGRATRVARPERTAEAFSCAQDSAAGSPSPKKRPERSPAERTGQEDHQPKIHENADDLAQAASQKQKPGRALTRLTPVLGGQIRLICRGKALIPIIKTGSEEWSACRQLKSNSLSMIILLVLKIRTSLGVENKETKTYSGIKVNPGWVWFQLLYPGPNQPSTRRKT